MEDKIKKIVVGGAYSTYGERRDMHIGFRWGDLRSGDCLEDPGVDRRIILKLIFMKLDGGMDWIQVAHGRDRWRALVNAAMNL